MQLKKPTSIRVKCGVAAVAAALLVTGAVTGLKPAIESGTIADASTIQTAGITGKVKTEDTTTAWDAAAATTIALSGTNAAISGSGAAVSGGTVTITAAGTYVVSGTLSKGQIVVNAGTDDLVRIVLNGAHITADQNAAIYAKSADKLVVTLAEGTQNTLTDAAGYTYTDTEKEEPNAALFSKCDLSINGTGKLTVEARFKHGIATKDDLVIAGGNLTVQAAGTAVRGKDSVTVLDGTFQLTAKDGDGLKAANDTDKGWIWIKDGTFQVNAHNDGIAAASALQIDGGTFNITAGGGHSTKISDDGSYKGIKSGSDLAIHGGTFTVDAADDGVHSNTNITIAGGTLSVQTGDDGVHAEDTLSISGGKVSVGACYEGIEANAIQISGGTVEITQATDDAINAAGSSPQISISGGTVKALASSDCLDSNGTVNISGGTVYLMSNATRDGDALDADGTVTFTGGTIVYGGLLRTGVNPSGSSTQSYVYTDGSVASGDVITVKQDGKTLLTFTAYADTKVLALSSPAIVSGQSYEIYKGSTLLTTATAGTGGGGGFPGGGFPGGNPPDGFEHGTSPDGFENGTPPEGVPGGGRNPGQRPQ